MTDTIITLTKTAAEKVLELLLHQSDGPYLRIFVTGGGCSGLNYGMTFANKEEDDIEFVSEGVSILVDKMSSLYTKGTVIDWEESLMGTGFKIDNPNAKATCGCGQSFSA